MARSGGGTMPRRGQNPSKKVDQVAQSNPVTVALITYIPFLYGYYRYSLDVLKVSINSILENTRGPFDLYIFDNASCEPVVEYLSSMQQRGAIDCLLLSAKNLGKVGAWNVLFQAAPGEYIAYADSDVYFFPGWLEKHLDIFDAFPRVGTVSGLPRRQRKDFCKHTLEEVRKIDGMIVDEGKFLEEAWIVDHARSLNKMDQLGKDMQRLDTRVTYGGVQAYVTATHFQFVVRKDIIKPYLPFPYERPMGPDVSKLDRSIDENGMLRLAVAERTVYHIGNVLDENEMRRVTGQEMVNLATRPSTPRKVGILHRTPLRIILMRIYDWIFRLYSD